jgi:23S rRNA pseudouridine1911/1915/1917 synthase
VSEIELTGQGGRRLDHFLQDELPQFSRSRIQEWIKAGRVTVDGVAKKASFDLRGGERIAVSPAALVPLEARPEAIALDILYEDESMVAINKPAGMTVHAGAGTHSGTLVNALLARYGQLSTAGGDDRPGIVHRLDKDTSGVMVAARHDSAHRDLAAQFANREVEKIYWALVEGQPRAKEGRVERPISRDPVRRIRMTASLETGRSALTLWRVLKRFDRCALLEVKIATGRTHQIRVHLASIRLPVVGDSLYGARPAPPLDRFFLHARQLTLRSPATGERLRIEAPLAPELDAYLRALN